MKNKMLFRCIIVSIPIVMMTAALLSSPYRYVKGCLYSNKGELDKISVYLRNIYVEGDTYKGINEDSDHNEIGAILGKLREQYQKDSEYPVFSSVDVYYDSDGDLMFYIQAKKKKLKNGNGVDSPDVRCYDLVYIDESYDGDVPVKYSKPFFENWYTWSFDTYSG